MNRLVLFNNSNTVDDGSNNEPDPTQIPDQQISIFNADDIASGPLDLTGANATDRMIIVQGDDESPFVTQVINKSQIKRVISKDYQPYVNQVTNIGFSGSGSLDLNVMDGDAYSKVTRLDKGFEQFPRATADITVLASDTSYDVANKLASAYNSLGGAKSFVRAEALVNESSTQLVDNDATPANITIDAIEGEKVVVAHVTAGADVDAAAGDYIRIGHATDLNYPVYKIEAIEVNGGAQTELNITLDRPYGSKSASGLAAGTLDSNDLSAVEAGVELTAKDLSEVSDYVESDAAISFNTALSPDFAGTTVSIASDPKTGSGGYEQMRQEERKAAGMQSGFYNRNYFPQTPEYYAKQGTNYDVVIVLVELDNDNAVVNQNRYLELVLAFDEGANIGTQLETFFGVS